MSIKHLKWILNKALFLICAYEGRILTERDCEQITAYTKKTYEDSKKNEYCKNIMLDVVCALVSDQEGRGKNNGR